jgi:hypothetical protein
MVDGDDLKTASMIQSGSHATSQQVAANMASGAMGQYQPIAANVEVKVLVNKGISGSWHGPRRNDHCSLAARKRTAGAGRCAR